MVERTHPYAGKGARDQDILAAAGGLEALLDRSTDKVLTAMKQENRSLMDEYLAKSEVKTKQMIEEHRGQVDARLAETDKIVHELKTTIENLGGLPSLPIVQLLPPLADQRRHGLVRVSLK